ncbi:hypothetical protein D3C87_253130 [compost metagenome]
MNLQEVRLNAKQYGLGELHKETGVARSRLYEFANGADLTQENLLKVLSCLGLAVRVVDLRDQSALDQSLAFYGAPVVSQVKRPVLSLEESVMGSLLQATTSSMYFEFAVYLLYRNSVDSFSLLQLAKMPKQRQLLGYAADCAFALKQKDELKELALELYDKYDEFNFSEGKASKYANLREQESKNNLARKWNVRTSTSLQTFKQRFEKWDAMNASAEEGLDE